MLSSIDEADFAAVLPLPASLSSILIEASLLSHTCSTASFSMRTSLDIVV